MRRVRDTTVVVWAHYQIEISLVDPEPSHVGQLKKGANPIGRSKIVKRLAMRSRVMCFAPTCVTWSKEDSPCCIRTMVTDSAPVQT